MPSGPSIWASGRPSSRPEEQADEQPEDRRHELRGRQLLDAADEPHRGDDGQVREHGEADDRPGDRPRREDEPGVLGAGEQPGHRSTPARARQRLRARHRGPGSSESRVSSFPAGARLRRGRRRREDRLREPSMRPRDPADGPKVRVGGPPAPVPRPAPHAPRPRACPRRRAPCPGSAGTSRPRGRGTSARVNPSRAASRSRRSSPPTARSSPSSPTSPMATVPVTTGRSRSDDARASASGRSRPGSLTERPPARFAYTSWLGQADPRPPAEDGDEQREPVGVDARGGAPRRGRGRRGDERLDLDEDRPRALQHRGDDAARRRRVVVGEECAGRVCDLGQAALPHLEHADLLGRAVAVLRRARSRRRPPVRSPSTESTTSTRCSRVFGPASVPSFVT